MYVLDTDVVSELRKVKAGKGNRNVGVWIESIEPVETFLSSITIHELELGILLLERKDSQQLLSERATSFDHVNATGVCRKSQNSPDLEGIAVWKDIAI